MKDKQGGKEVMTSGLFFLRDDTQQVCITPQSEFCLSRYVPWTESMWEPKTMVVREQLIVWMSKTISL